MIKVVQPNENDNGYNYEFSINGEKGTGYLTYDLMENLGTRTLLLTSKTNIIRDENIRKNFQALKNHISLHKNKGGAFYKAKGMVNDIYNRQINIPNISIAVHKYGPVPVCVIPDVFEIEFNGTKRECRIGIYPYIKGDKIVGKNSSRTALTSIEFLQSLHIRLDVILTRYFEDVAENFFDIENHSDLPSAIKKAKNCEIILSESITSKIDHITAVTKGTSNEQNHEIGKLRRELNKNYSEVIFKSKYAKYFAYFFINELYKSTGFSSKNFKRKFEILRINNENFDSYIDNDIDLLLLRKCIRNYETGKGRETIEQDLAGQTSTLWIKRFIHFSSFIYYQEKENSLSPHTTKIFLSNRFTKSDSQVLKIKIEDLINEYFFNRVNLLAVNEDSAGKFINEIVKSRIWLSNATYSALPSISSSNKENFDWIAKEVLHSETLKKQLLFILNKEQDGSLLDSFKKHLINLNDYLSPQSRNINLNKENIIKKLDNKLHAKFDSQSIKDDLFKQSLKENIKELIDAKIINIIEAWLNQFDNQTSSLILDINKKLKYPCRISEASKRSFGSNSEIHKKKFKKVWNYVRNRKLTIDNKEFTLIQSIGNTSSTQYKQNLPNIIQALIGKDQDLNMLLNRCYNLKGF